MAIPSWLCSCRHEWIPVSNDSTKFQDLSEFLFCAHTGILFFILQTKLLYHLCLQRKKTGVEGLIEIENPNRVAQKSKKVTQIELDEPRQLSRRERFVSANIQQELWFSFACKAIRYKIILQLCSNSSNWNSSCSKVKYY